jgi:uncharacterized Zn finger protein
MLASEWSDMSGIDDWFDEKTLLDLVPPPVFLQGASAVENGAVRILERDDVHLHSHVEDTEIYEAEFSLRDGQLAWTCTCGQAESHPCEHLLATALATWPGEAPDEE